MPYMQRFLLGFCAGAVVLALPWPGPPAVAEWLASAGAALLILGLPAALLARRRHGSGRRLWRLAWSGLPLGLLWSGLAHDGALDARLAAGPSGSEVTFTGRVMTEPAALATGPEGPPAVRFQARVARQSAGPGIGAEGATVRLSWYGAPPLARGEVWHWTAVLQEPWSYANPGGFDHERWLLGEGIQGTGYVREGKRLTASPPGLVARARNALIDVITGLQLENGGVLLALLVGQGSQISDGRWEVLRATGTVHLMVVSGLHVSLAAALGFAAGGAACRMIPRLPLWLDARAAGCLGGAAVAVVYVVLAGAGLPALRALVMSAATLALLSRGRTTRLGSGLLAALAVLLLTQPLAVHQQGFWLSFGAVAILYLALGHRHGGGRTRGLLRAQLALSLGMLPLVAAATGTVPWTGVPANLVAVPVMSLVVVPVTLLSGLLAVVSPWAAGWGLHLADLVVSGVFHWLEWLAGAPLPLAPGGWLALIVAQAGALCWLLGVPRLYLPALLLCVGLAAVIPVTGVTHGRYRVTALDVGQGSAVLVDTRHHRLLFDAGPGFPGGFETGSAVVVPSLLATGPPRLDVLVLSHDDVDHVGGARYVEAALSPRRVVRPRAAGPPYCGPRRWRWDGVQFRLLSVPRPPAAADNDRSCILLVDDGEYPMLIAGDISARVEAGLLRVMARRRRTVHLMFAPHHGSASSSSRALVRVLRPSLVLVSAGRGNRFGHPHPDVVARYVGIGARVLQTGREGALIWHSGRPGHVVRWRRDRSAYWRGRDAAGAPSP